MAAVRLVRVHAVVVTGRVCKQNSLCGQKDCFHFIERQLTELRELLEPRQRVAPKHHVILHSDRSDLIRVGELEVALGGLGRLPFHAILRDEDAELITIIEHVHICRVVEVVCVRGGAKKELSSCLEEFMKALALLLRRGQRTEAGQQPRHEHQ